MIKPEIYYEVTCDKCGRKYMEGDTIIAFGSKEEAVETANKAGWFYSPKAGCVYCPDCFAAESNG